MKRLRGAVVGYGFIRSAATPPATRASAPDVEIVAVADIARRAAAVAARRAARAPASTRTHRRCSRPRRTGSTSSTSRPRPATTPRSRTPRSSAACTCCARSRSPRRSPTPRAHARPRAPRPSACSSRATTTSTRRSSRRCARILDVGAHRPGPPGDAADLPQHPRQGRDRVAHATGAASARYSGGGIAMDHGSHTFYLAFDWLRGYPTAITARATTMGPFDTEDNFSCSAHASRPASPPRTSPGPPACARSSTRSTASAARSASRTTTSRSRSRSGARPAPSAGRFERRGDRVGLDGREPRHLVQLDVRPVRAAIERGDYVGKEAEEAFRCVELITTAYASARDGSRELPLAGLAALGGDDLSDRMVMKDVSSA